MSSTKCSKCNKLNCGCVGHGLTTPCTYTNCSDPNAEPCESLECMSCVSNCKVAFSVNINGVILKVEQGERLQETLQNIFLYLQNPLSITLAPFNIGISAVTATTITVTWDQVSSYAVAIEYKQVQENTWITAEDSTSGDSFEITGLTSGTEYMIKVSANGDDSVAVYATTL
jgi:hypothetical protein